MDFDSHLSKKAPETYRVHRNLLDNHVLNTNLPVLISLKLRVKTSKI